jgi:hypothetical protein
MTEVKVVLESMNFLFLSKIHEFRNKMYKIWSNQVEDEGIKALCRFIFNQ